MEELLSNNRVWMIDYVIVGLVDFWRRITTFIDGVFLRESSGSLGDLL